MGGVPKIGRMSHLSSGAEELMHAPEAQVLGSLDLNALNDEPPPWETKQTHNQTDARRFVDYPDEWEVRWINPRLASQFGMRYWRAIPADHDRVKVLIPQMHAADNTVRRFDHNGDFLAYMPKAWIASRDRMKRDRVDRARGLDRKKAEDTRESINRGDFGPYVKVDHIKRPSNTQGEGSSMVD